MIFDLPKDDRSIIKVIGVGGGGSNAVNHMFTQGIVGVDFAICNTDAQAMDNSPIPTKIQLGPTLTEGRGAGSKPTIGRQACIESIEDVKAFLAEDTKMLFVTAGMGGGTGTGAAPIIAKTAQEMDILTVGIVTLPFTFEGRKRITHGMEGLDDLKKNVDTLIVISNDKLREIHGNLSLSAAFSQADNILTTAAKGIAEIITVPGYVNVDFEDVNTVMRNSGVAIMGTSTMEGDNRAKRAVDAALSSPLLEDSDIRGAQHILLNITSGNKEVTMDEIFEITEFVQEEAGFGTNLIWGNCFDETLGDNISVTIIATGFEHKKENKMKEAKNDQKIRVPLDGGHNTMKSDRSVFDLGHSDGDAGTTFEFEDIKTTIEKIQKKQHSYDEPYVKEQDQEKLEEERRTVEAKDTRKRDAERKRQGSVRLNNPQTIVELENEPAYLRRNIRLDDVPHSSDTNMSKYTIGEDDESQISADNPFLHDNVD